ncbi:hypothetical protein [Peribacillus simplex]
MRTFASIADHIGLETPVMDFHDHLGGNSCWRHSGKW